MEIEWNVSLFRTINDLGKEYEFLNWLFITIADYTIYALAAVLLVLWAMNKGRDRLMVICGLVSCLFAVAAGKLIGKLYANQNPFAELQDVSKLIEKEIGNSFPSDHTILFFSICFTFFLFRKKNGYLWILLALAVGFSRIWVGVHYPADIMAGAAIGILSAWIFYKAIPKMRIGRKLQKKEEKPAA